MTPLRQRMTEDMRLRNLSAATQVTYLHHVSAFAQYYDVSPERLGLDGESDVRPFVKQGGAELLKGGGTAVSCTDIGRELQLDPSRPSVPSQLRRSVASMTRGELEHLQALLMDRPEFKDTPRDRRVFVEAAGLKSFASGFDFTGADCCGWLKDAGFRETRVEHLAGPDSMVVGVK